MLPLPKCGEIQIQFRPDSKRSLLELKGKLAASEVYDIHRDKRAVRFVIPPWTVSDEKCQRVIAELAWRASYMKGRFPVEQYETDKMKLVLTLEARLREQGHSTKPTVNSSKPIKQLERDQYKKHAQFGRLALYASILYLAYRMRMRSPEIADTVCDGDGSCSPPFVRQVLGRANMIARRLWPNECFVLHHTCKDPNAYMERICKPTKFERAYKILPPDENLNEMLEKGTTLSDIAAKYGAPKSQVFCAINRHRRFAGLRLLTFHTGKPRRDSGKFAAACMNALFNRLAHEKARPGECPCGCGFPLPEGRRYLLRHGNRGKTRSPKTERAAQTSERLGRGLDYTLYPVMRARSA